MGTKCTKFRDVGIVRHLLSLKRVSVRPRNRHRQKPGDLMHGQKLGVVFVSVVYHCGPLLQMLRGQNTLRGHRAVGLERPHELLWARKRAQKWGRSSPIRCFVRAQIHRRAMCNFFSFGLFRKSGGDAKGDGWGDLCLSCTVHPQKKNSGGRLEKLHDNVLLLAR